ncbi:GNAT family N-acetyltransferase [Clostridium aminobutyricum]|uniref:GNAT family N-acetyltransferase n=1 Tax=Clostridium aminobutyricum TaxID=33953 RepID=A0A939DAD2_CLOAM|nr:GNAT family N-acetyltransferase [Clostridium aminobutyricum]MBN7773977.1 GNAT family N-acetyltransferase [Clostridium aminobutyricum]
MDEKNTTNSIRIGTVNDIQLILQFRRSMFEEIGVEESLFIENVQEILLDLYMKELKADRIRHFIAYDVNDRPIAVMGSLMKTDFPYYLFKPGFYGWIIDAYTVKEYRGQGLATKLLELNSEWLKEKGAQEIKLIASGNEARRVYEKFGFKATWEMSLNLSKVKTFNEIIEQR